MYLRVVRVASAVANGDKKSASPLSLRLSKAIDVCLSDDFCRNQHSQHVPPSIILTPPVGPRLAPSSSCYCYCCCCCCFNMLRNDQCPSRLSKVMIHSSSPRNQEGTSAWHRLDGEIITITTDGGRHQVSHQSWKLCSVHCHHLSKDPPIRPFGTDTAASHQSSSSPRLVSSRTPQISAPAYALRIAFSSSPSSPSPLFSCRSAPAPAELLNGLFATQSLARRLTTAARPLPSRLASPRRVANHPDISPWFRFCPRICRRSTFVRIFLPHMNARTLVLRLVFGCRQGQQRRAQGGQCRGTTSYVSDCLPGWPPTWTPRSS
ncbi:hypothetical protein BKA81DRAFT_209923 [Phyllosticta paracitricarpa]|uniref:Uncharacterized protein n=2 Tax=Phyllosticta TaxID=121621 RepID=A0ABR1M9A3_9PEZI